MAAVTTNERTAALEVRVQGDEVVVLDGPRCPARVPSAYHLAYGRPDVLVRVSGDRDLVAAVLESWSRAGLTAT